ncbi:MAG: hypothetical protein ABSG43_03605 [Solirubrobacteraceae bacterium]
MQNNTPGNQTPPAIIGTTLQAQTLNASPGTWTSVGNTYSYQWQRSTPTGYQPIAGATQATYTLTTADVGQKIEVVVTASNTGGQRSATSQPVGPVSSDIPFNTVPPAITGTPARASTLQASPGTWNPTASAYTYQWEHCTTPSLPCTPITGATGQTYTLQKTDESQAIAVMVTASNAYGHANAQSNFTAPASATPPASTQAPAVTGTPQRAVTLQGTQGTWTGAGNTYSYQWEDCNSSGQACASIKGATQPSYTLAQSDEGHAVVLAVTATNPDGSTAASSRPTGAVAALLPASTHAPVISGAGQQGQTLAITQQAWSVPAGTTYGYAWELCNSAGQSCTPIASASSTSYTLPASAVGQTLVAVATATDPDGTVKATSAPSAVVLAAKSSKTAAVTLTAAASTPAPVTNAQGTVLATAQLQSTMQAEIAQAKHRASGSRLVLKLRRAPGVNGALRVWVQAAGHEQKLTLRGQRAAVSLPAAMTGKVLIVIGR